MLCRMTLCTLFHCLYVLIYINATYICPVPPKEKNHEYFTITTFSSIISNMILINNSVYFKKNKE